MSLIQNTHYLQSDAILCNDTPAKILPILFTIRSIQEWNDIGFKVTIDKHENVKTRHKIIRFSKVYDFTDTVWEAIHTKKKMVNNGFDVYFFIKRGFSFNDFVGITNDLISYCNAMDYYESKQYDLARNEIEKALSLVPHDHSYSLLYYDICFLLQDTTVIDDEIEYNLKVYRGISSMVHSGNLERWIRLLVKLKKYDDAGSLINRANILFDEQINKSVNNEPKSKEITFSIQTPIAPVSLSIQNSFIENNNDVEFAKYKKEQFNNRIAALKTRISKHGFSFIQ